VNLRVIAAIAITSLVAGCASIGQSSALATPWGVAGLHTFAKAAPVETQESPYTDGKISQMLREQSSESPTLVASRDP